MGCRGMETSPWSTRLYCHISDCKHCKLTLGSWRQSRSVPFQSENTGRASGTACHLCPGPDGSASPMVSFQLQLVASRATKPWTPHEAQAASAKVTKKAGDHLA